MFDKPFNIFNKLLKSLIPNRKQYAQENQSCNNKNNKYLEKYLNGTKQYRLMELNLEEQIQHKTNHIICNQKFNKHTVTEWLNTERRLLENSEYNPQALDKYLSEKDSELQENIKVMFTEEVSLLKLQKKKVR